MLQLSRLQKCWSQTDLMLRLTLMPSQGSSLGLIDQSQRPGRRSMKPVRMLIHQQKCRGRNQLTLLATS